MKELEYSGQMLPKDRRFCTLCGRVRRESAFDGDSTHCKECCEKMRHTHLHWYGIIPAVLMLVAVVLAVVLGVQMMSFTRQIHAADALAADHAMYDAVEAYEAALDSLKNENGKTGFIQPGLRTWEKYFTAYAEAYSEYDAASEAVLKLNYRQMQKSEMLSAMQKRKEAYDKVYNKMAALSEEHGIEKPSDMPYEEMLEQLRTAEFTGDKTCIAGYKKLFEASMTQFYYTDKYDASFSMLDEALELLPWEYLTIYSTRAQLAMDGKDYSEVIGAAQQILNHNKNNLDAYEWMAESYYAMGKKDEAMATLEQLQAAVPDSSTYYKLRVKYAIRDNDLTLAENLCTQHDEANTDKVGAIFNSVLKQKDLTRKEQRIFLQSIDYTLWEAVLMLLQNDPKSAFDIAYNYAFNYTYYYNYINNGGQALPQHIINVTTLCAELCKGDEKADEVKSSMSDFGMCDAQTQKIIDGKISLVEAFVEGKVDIL